MEELLDLLMSFVDFQAFKELMLAFKFEAVTSSIHVRTKGVSFLWFLHVAVDLKLPSIYYSYWPYFGWASILFYMSALLVPS